VSDDGLGDFPRDIAAERAALGCMLLSPAALADCLEMLQPDDFARPAHQEIFAAIAAISARSEPADALTLKAELEHRGTLGKVGRADYLHSLISCVPSPTSASWYAQRVRECSVRWRMSEAGDGIKDAAISGDVDLGERIDRAYRLLDEAAGKAMPPKARSIADLIDPALAAIENGTDKERGIMTGWADLDELISGFRPGQLITVGARPGMGKSVSLVNVAVHAALGLGLPVLACTLEMSEQEYVERILAAEAEVDLKRIRESNLTDEDWRKIADVRKRLVTCPHLIINEDQYLTLQGIRSDLRTMRRAGMPAALVTVDYLQLMTTNGKPESREREVGEISRGLKQLAKEFKVPIFVGSQLNRGPEMRSDHRPLQADLRDSGSVEQDSDIVILLYRADKYEQESAHAGEIDFIVAKNRSGREGTVTMAFQGHYARCSDMYRPWGPATVIQGVA
jgi:replicative DNA helicase